VFALGTLFLLWESGKEESAGVIETLGRLNAFQWILVASVVSSIIVGIILLQRREKRKAAAREGKPLGLPIDSMAPSFELPAYDGGTKSLKQLLSYGKPLMLIFTNPHCGPCVVLFKEIQEWQDMHREQLTIALISRGTIKENFVNVARNRLGEVLLQKKREIGEKYGAGATPTAVLITTEGRIASYVAAGADEIRDLLNKVLNIPSTSNNGNHQPDGNESAAGKQNPAYN
jgi:thiol-disulfide isomerase/thioredoxin